MPAAQARAMAAAQARVLAARAQALAAQARAMIDPLQQVPNPETPAAAL